jgi:hypothetical protein
MSYAILPLVMLFINLAVSVQDDSAAPQISIDHTEIIQSVQRSDNSVHIIAGKETLVRFVLSSNASSATVTNGSIRLTKANGSLEVKSDNDLLIDPGANNQIESKRSTLDGTLNFTLQPEWTEPGTLTVELIDLRETRTGKSLSCRNCSLSKVKIEFLPVRPLEIQIIAVGYYVPASQARITPRQEDIDSIKSWLTRAYPASQVLISVRQSTFEDLRVQWPALRNQACSNIKAAVTIVRNTDVQSSPKKSRVHYYGLIADTGQFVIGRSDVADHYDPDNVVWIGCGPSGKPTTQGYRWDKSGSYAGWYAGHELAHTFGLRHPITSDSTPPRFDGCSEEEPFDGHYPYRRGRISDETVSNVGLDFRAEQAGTSKSLILPGTWTDIMTYCDNQWISDYTYEALFALSQKAPASSGGRPSALAPQVSSTEQVSSKSLAIVATINITKMTGTLRDVRQIDHPVSQKPLTESDAVIRLSDEHGNTIHTYPVSLYMEGDTRKGEDKIGSINSSIPYSDETDSVQLLFRDKILATIKASHAPPALITEMVLKPSEKLSQPDIGIMTAAGIQRKKGVLVQWGRQPLSPETTYTVQISADGEDWETIAINLKKHAYLIAKRNYEQNKSGLLHVRIIANNGFSSSTTLSQTISLPVPKEK